MGTDVALVVVPPGPGFCTLALPIPGIAVSNAESAAWSVAAFTKIVGRGVPFQSTVELLSNPAPLRVRTVAEPDCRTEGEMPAMMGVGLTMLNGNAADWPPWGAGFATVTWATDPAASAEAGSVALSSDELTKVAWSAIPFHVIAEEGTKPVPVRMRVWVGEPAGTDAGSRA
jgi:hypothetical protein